MKIYCLVFFGFLLSCGNHSNNSPLNKYDSTRLSMETPSNDEELNSAILKAKKSFPDFLDSLKSPCPECSNYGLEMNFKFGNGGRELLWFGNLFFKGERLFGILLNSPKKQKLNVGDTIEINYSDVTDWSYVRNNKLIGGYTTRIMYKKLSEQDKKQMRKGLPPDFFE